jgi:hypothetical protein
MRLLITLIVLSYLALVSLLASACSSDDESGGVTSSPSASPSPTPAATLLPPDAQAGTRVFQEFVDAVLSDDLTKAWELYAASIEGTTEENDPSFGCDFSAFSSEFPRIKHLFDRMKPFAVTETYAEAPGSAIIEMRLVGVDGTSFLGTVERVHPLEEYRVRFMNSGNVTQVPGAPDPQPSPGDPAGFCGIWTGGR